MRKILTLALSVLLVLSAAGCGTPDIEKIASINPTPRPLLYRQELLDDALEEFDDIMAQYSSADDAKKEKLAPKIAEARTIQSEAKNGINGEEDMEILTDRVEVYNHLLQSYIDKGNEKGAKETQEAINEIMYGNKEGKKTW